MLYAICSILDVETVPPKLFATLQEHSALHRVLNINTLYKLITEGDFNLENLPESLREVFNKYFGDENQVIDLGNRSVNVKYGFTIKKDEKTGKWTGIDGKEYDTKDEAM